MRGKEAVPRNLLGGWGVGQGTVLLGRRVVFYLQLPGQDLPGVWWSLLLVLREAVLFLLFFLLQTEPGIQSNT